jgi:hypothetical protein
MVVVIVIVINNEPALFDAALRVCGVNKQS